MKLPMSCMKCYEEFGKPGEFSSVELLDGGRYEFVCPNGHQTTSLLQQ